jgi:hypothetical protein
VQDVLAEARNSSAPSKFGLMGKTEQRAFPRLPECTKTLAGGALQSGNTLWKI